MYHQIVSPERYYMGTINLLYGIIEMYLPIKYRDHTVRGLFTWLYCFNNQHTLKQYNHVNNPLTSYVAVQCTILLILGAGHYDLYLKTSYLMCYMTMCHCPDPQDYSYRPLRSKGGRRRLPLWGYNLVGLIQAVRWALLHVYSKGMAPGEAGKAGEGKQKLRY
ncbi:hypothetical protein BU15DRAFT_69040 [Melanogaster broomeanus]|nr:hypothetical protein BU15DRAFT_69040 [Melanogaster broomeanus]